MFILAHATCYDKFTPLVNPQSIFSDILDCSLPQLSLYDLTRISPMCPNFV